MEDSHEWTIVYMEGNDLTTERVYADGWQIGPNGDLIFLNDPYGGRPLPLRAFAKGVWLKVRLYN